MLITVCVLSAVVVWLGVVIALEHRSTTRKMQAAHVLRENLREQVTAKDGQCIRAVAEKDRITRMHIDLGQEYCQLAERCDDFQRGYNEVYDAYTRLEADRTFAAEKAAATQTTVEIHEAELVDNVPLPAWDAQTSVHRVPVGPDPESPTDWWDRAALNARIEAEQMALAGGAA